MVRSTFFGFTTAMRGLNASQRALDITGHNIGNVDTPGYTRQRLDLYSSISGGYSSRYSTQNSISVGGGVEMGGVSQMRDPFLDVRFRKEANKLGEVDSRITVLKDLTAIFDETMSDGIAAQVSDVIAQLETLTQNTGQAQFDNVVKASTDILTKMLNQYSNKTSQIRESQDKELKDVTIPDINLMLKNIANLNKSIETDMMRGNPALELIDRRNAMVDELSTFMNISVTEENPIEITKGITLRDYTINFLGPDNRPIGTLVSGKKAAELNYSKAPDGKTLIGFSPSTSEGPFDETVKAMNSIIDEIAKLNDSINAYTNVTPPNTAKDTLNLKAITEKQDKLIEQLQIFMPDATATVEHTGGKNYKSIEINQHSLLRVDGGGNSSKTPITLLNNGKDVMVGSDKITTSVTSIVISDKFSTGILKGTLDILNKSGEFDNPPNTNRGIGYYEKMLDTIANELATEFNDMNSLHNSSNANIDPGFDPNQPESATNLKYTANQAFLNANPGWQAGVADPVLNPNGDLYPPGNQWKPLFADKDGKVPITAGGLCIAQGWVDSDYGITNTKKPIVPGDTSGQNENIQALKKLFDKKIQFMTPGSNGLAPQKLFEGSFLEVFGQTTSVLDLDLNSNTKIFKNYVSVLNGIDDARASVSSVNLDEEAVNMMKYQKSYNAAARMITTLDEALNTIINNMGRVGV